MSSTEQPRARSRKRLGRSALLIAAIVLVFVQLFPLFWMFSGAFRPPAEVGSVTLFPRQPTLDNIVLVFQRVPFARYLFNSFFVSVAVAVLSVGFGAMAGYALARLRFPGREFIFSLFFATLLVALPVILVPLFVIVSRLRMADSYIGLILPVSFTAFPVFLMRQFYLQFPGELEEAAEVDGAGHLRRFVSLIVPLSRPMLAALGVLTFLAAWNGFLWPLVAARDPSLWVVQVGIATFQSQYGAEWNVIMAASMLAAVPTLLVFLILQRQIIDSIMAGGLKG